MCLLHWQIGMRKQRRCWLFGLWLAMVTTVHAEPITDIVSLLKKIHDGKLTHMDAQISRIGEQTLERLQKQHDLLEKSLIGNRIYGSQNYSDFSSWGKLEDWPGWLNAYQNGQTSLGGVAKKLEQEFPLKDEQPHQKNIKQKTDDLMAKTALALRAASQLTLESLERQLAYQQQLRVQIDKTTDLKSSLDLQNRLQLENNLIQLQLVRLVALSNQQQALDSQAHVNQTTMARAFVPLK